MRKWTEQTIESARQNLIQHGDKVRSFDFPGSRDDCYIEGVVIAASDDTVTYHATRAVVEGSEVPANRVYRAPLGIGSFSRQPAVFLIEKRPAAACPRCGGWTACGGMSSHHQATVPVLGRYGCSCEGGNLTLKFGE